MSQNEVTTLPRRNVTTVDRGTPQSFSLPELERLALAFAKSGLFGVKNVEQALALMLIAQAEGRHPALAAQDYSIIQGRPSKTAAAMQRDFMAAGGRIEWHDLSDNVACATFSHPQGGTIRILWDQARVKQAGLSGREMHSKYPRQMLRARCVSEGVKTIYPMATGGMYTPEEVRDMPYTALPDERSDTTADLDQFAAVTGEAEPPPAWDAVAEARIAADSGTGAFRSFWQQLTDPDRDLVRAHMDEFRTAAQTADDPLGLPPLPAADPVTEMPQPPVARDVFAELDHEARAATRDGVKALRAWWKKQSRDDIELIRELQPDYERLAAEADAQRGLAL